MHVTKVLRTTIWATCSFMLGMGNTAAQAAPNLASSKQASSTANKPMSHQDKEHLTGDASIGDMLRHSAFAGFGRLLLPWDERRVDEALLLKQAGTLLPYHSHVNPNTVVSALNHMIDDAGVGKTIFYEFYSEAQKQADPELAQTGLFFFRGKPGAPFAIIAPGGGFQYVGSLHEGFPYAAEIASSGYNAFVLKYRVGSGGSKAIADLAAALTYIFKHADTLGVDTHGYSLWGSSAGARMAAAIGTHGAARFGGADLPKPAAIVTAYTGHSEVGPVEPPTFVVVGEHDGIAPPAAMQRRVDALKRARTKVELHVYPDLGHGFGLGIGTSAEGWVSEATQFWAKNLN
jgi:acetyl esterase/lipase